MTRAICLGFFAFAVVAGSAQGTEPAGDEFIPGFDQKIAWNTIARIELIEGQESFKSVGKEQSRTTISEVVLYRFRDNERRPMARAADVVVPASETQDEPASRLEKRGKTWQALVAKHNPSIQLEVIHRDTAKSQGWMGGMNVKYDVKQQSMLNKPTDALTVTARAEELDAMQAMLAEHQRRKDVATFWYYAGNALLGCATLAVLAFVILPAVRKEAPLVASSPPETASETQN